MAGDLFVDSGGIRLAVRDHGGTGPPIVLVHGHVGNLAEYDELGPMLARHLRVITYDQRGQGWSEAGPVGPTTFAADLLSVVQAMELDRPVLFGSSFGSLVCLAYALAGGSTRGFVNQDGRVADFEPIDPPEPPPPGRSVLSCEQWTAYVQGFAAFGRVGELTARRATVHRGDDSYEIRPSAEHAFQKERAAVEIAVLDGYRAVDAPTLVLAARRGHRLDQREAELDRLEAAVGATIRWYDTGHWISAEDPAGVADAVVAFASALR